MMLPHPPAHRSRLLLPHAAARSRSLQRGRTKLSTTLRTIWDGEPRSRCMCGAAAEPGTDRGLENPILLTPVTVCSDGTLKFGIFHSLSNAFWAANAFLCADLYGGLPPEALMLLLKIKDAQIVKDERVADQLLAEKDVRIQEKDELLMKMEMNLADKEEQLMEVRSRTRALFINRVLLEIGVTRYHSQTKANGQSLSMTARFKRFVKEEMLQTGPELSEQAEELRSSLVNSTASDRNVAKAMSDLFETVSQPHHHLQGLTEPGIACGGEEPLGTAVALCVLQLQAEKCLNVDVQFVDGQGKCLHLLKGGKQQLPPPWM